MEMSSRLCHLNKRKGLRLRDEEQCSHLYALFVPPCNIKAAPFKNERHSKIWSKTVCLPQWLGPDPLLWAGPKKSAFAPRFLKLLPPTTLCLELPPLKITQLAQIFWPFSCSRGKGNKHIREVITFVKTLESSLKPLPLINYWLNSNSASPVGLTGAWNAGFHPNDWQSQADFSVCPL